MPFKRKSQTELTVLSIILIIAILLFTVRVYSIQVANSKKLAENIDGAASVMTSVIKAPRGEILDCFGRRIAINRDGYNIVFNKAYVGKNLNDVILALVLLMEEKETVYNDMLPMSKNAPFSFLNEEEYKKDITKLKEKLELAHYATAENCFEEMVKRYKLEDYSKEDARRIMGIRYSMVASDFSVSYPFTFAEDI